jgi:hypothetical protein
MTGQILTSHDQIWDQLNKSDEAKAAIFSSAIMLMSEIDTIEKAADKIGGLE